MNEQHASSRNWIERRRQARRVKRQRTGDSPEKRAGHHTPREGVIGRMLRLGGVERESRFKP
jgi:hypothetical protein